MKLQGRFKSISRDFESSKVLMTLELDNNLSGEFLESIRYKLLDIEIKIFKKKRSKDANALMWACLSELAAVRCETNWGIYLDMLRKYGQFTYAYFKPETLPMMKVQWRETMIVGETEINGTKYLHVLCFYGSHTYDTQQFGKLLDGIVTEMIEEGLQPPASEEMKRSLELWEKRTQS